MIREVLTLQRLSEMPPAEAAAIWTVRLAEGGQTHETDLFEQWLELAPENRVAWQQMNAAFEALDDGSDNELLGAMRAHARQAGPVRSERWPRAAAAAALVVALLTGSLVADRFGLFGEQMASNGGRSMPSPGAAPLVHYANGRDLPKSIALPDGSHMTLDAETRVTASFTPGARQLNVLGGRAYFAVQHDSKRPFVVHARHLEVTAVGTEFDVRTSPRDVRVHLVEGRLAVKGGRPSKSLMLTAGQNLVLPDNGVIAISQAAAEDTDWRQGYATFEDETLADAAAVLNRYPGDRLRVTDPRVAGLRISGNFKVGNAERFGHSLAQIYAVRVVRRGPNEVELVPSG
jgi:transmembrane sensor